MPQYNLKNNVFQVKREPDENEDKESIKRREILVKKKVNDLSHNESVI